MMYRLIKYKNPLNGNYVSYRVQMKLLWFWITLRPASNSYNKDFYNQDNASNVFDFLTGINKPEIEVIREK